MGRSSRRSLHDRARAQPFACAGGTLPTERLDLLRGARSRSIFDRLPHPDQTPLGGVACPASDSCSRKLFAPLAGSFARLGNVESQIARRAEDEPGLAA